MPVLVLNQSQVRQLLPMAACIEQLERGFKALALGQAVNPLRQIMRVPGQTDVLGTMPGYSADPVVLGIKVVTVFPGNHGTALDSHQGVVLLFDQDNGALVAMMDASELTAIRTAAASAVATRALARNDSSVLALLGSGVQARTHLQAMLAVRPIQQVLVFSPHTANRERFAAQATAQHGIEAVATATAEAAVTAADIVCTVSAAREPIMQSDWLKAGTHINAVGSSTPKARELDSATVARARLFVDRLESALNEAGDILTPIKQGLFEADHIQAEIGQVLLQQHPGRTHADEITVYKSLGLAMQDIVSADYAYRQARQQGLGQTIELGGLREAR